MGEGAVAAVDGADAGGDAPKQEVDAAKEASTANKANAMKSMKDKAKGIAGAAAMTKKMKEAKNMEEEVRKKREFGEGLEAGACDVVDATKEGWQEDGNEVMKKRFRQEGLEGLGIATTEVPFGHVVKERERKAAEVA